MQPAGTAALADAAGAFAAGQHLSPPTETHLHRGGCLLGQRRDGPAAAHMHRSRPKHVCSGDGGVQTLGGGGGGGGGEGQGGRQGRAAPAVASADCPGCPAVLAVGRCRSSAHLTWQQRAERHRGKADAGDKPSTHAHPAAPCQTLPRRGRSHQLQKEPGVACQLGERGDATLADVKPVPRYLRQGRQGKRD